MAHRDRVARPLRYQQRGCDQRHPAGARDRDHRRGRGGDGDPPQLVRRGQIRATGDEGVVHRTGAMSAHLRVLAWAHADKRSIDVRITDPAAVVDPPPDPGARGRPRFAGPACGHVRRDRSAGLRRRTSRRRRRRRAVYRPERLVEHRAWFLVGRSDPRLVRERQLLHARDACHARAVGIVDRWKDRDQHRRRPRRRCAEHASGRDLPVHLEIVRRAESRCRSTNDPSKAPVGGPHCPRRAPRRFHSRAELAIADAIAGDTCVPRPTRSHSVTGIRRLRRGTALGPARDGDGRDHGSTRGRSRRRARRPCARPRGAGHVVVLGWTGAK